LLLNEMATMARATLQDIIHNFSPEGFIDFFRLKNHSLQILSNHIVNINTVWYNFH